MHEACFTPSHRKLFAPSTGQCAVTVLSAPGTGSVNSAPLTCFLSSLRRFISAAFSSLLMPTRLGCVAFAVTCCDAGGVAVGDRLGVACLRGVTARRGITAKGFISTLWLMASHESTYSRLVQAMVSLRAARHMSRVPGPVRLRMHLDQRSASVHSSEGERPSHSNRPGQHLRP